MFAYTVISSGVASLLAFASLGLVHFWPAFFSLSVALAIVGGMMGIVVTLWAMAPRVMAWFRNRGQIRPAFDRANRNPRWKGLWTGFKAWSRRFFMWASRQFGRLFQAARPHVRAAGQALVRWIRANPWMFWGILLSIAAIVLLVFLIMTKDSDYVVALVLLLLAAAACFITHYGKWGATRTFLMKHWEWVTFIVMLSLFGFSFLRHWDMEWKVLYGAAAVLSLLKAFGVLGASVEWFWKVVTFKKGEILGSLGLAGTFIVAVALFFLLKGTTPFEIASELFQNVLEIVPMWVATGMLAIVVFVVAAFFVKRFAAAGEKALSAFK